VSGFTKFEKPYAIRDAGGLIVYESAAFLQGVEDFKNTSASTLIVRGGAVIIDQVNSAFPRWDYSTAGTDTLPKCLIGGIRVASATSTCYLGVALENVPAGQMGRVATTGSISAVNCATSLTSAVLGNSVIGHATAGLVDAVATAPAVGLMLGMMVVINGAASGSSGSTGQLSVLIAQH
jgi:hypothetical protein